MKGTIQRDLRELGPGEQLHAAHKTFAELPARQSAEFIVAVPLYGFCIALLEGGQKFSWKRLEEGTWRITATKASYPSLNEVSGVHHPAVLGDSTTVCVTDREQRVWLIDAVRNRIAAEIVVGGNPSHLAVHPDGNLIYVGCPGSDQVAVIDARRRRKIASFPVGKGGQLPKISPDGRYAAIDCSRTNDVYLVDVEGHRVIFKQTVGNSPHESVFTPDGRFLCVPCASGELYLIPPVAPERSTILSCGFGAGHIDFSSDARYAYVANSLEDDVAIVDLHANQVVGRVPCGAGAHRPTLCDDDSLLFVANFIADTVTVIDTQSREVTATVPVGTYPHDVVKAPGGSLVACSYGAGTCTLIDPHNPMASRELKTGEGTSHCTFLPGRPLALFANSISKDMAVVDLEDASMRTTIPVPDKAMQAGCP